MISELHKLHNFVDLHKYVISTILFWLRERSRNGTIMIKLVAKNLSVDKKTLKFYFEGVVQDNSQRYKYESFFTAINTRVCVRALKSRKQVNINL